MYRIPCSDPELFTDLISVNAAGVVTDEPFLTTSDKKIEKTFAVNVG